MHDCFDFHCYIGGQDFIGCTIIHSGRTLLNTELNTDSPLWLVCGDWSTSVSLWDLGKFDLWICFASWLFFRAFPTFLGGVSYRGAGISFESFSHYLGLTKLCEVAPLVNPLKTCHVPVCWLYFAFSLFHGFMEWVVEIFNNAEVLFDLFHCLSGLYQCEV